MGGKPSQRTGRSGRRAAQGEAARGGAFCEGRCCVNRDVKHSRSLCSCGDGGQHEGASASSPVRGVFCSRGGMGVTVSTQPLSIAELGPSRTSLLPQSVLTAPFQAGIAVRCREGGSLPRSCGRQEGQVSSPALSRLRPCMNTHHFRTQPVVCLSRMGPVQGV